MTIQALKLDEQKIAYAQDEANAIANSAHNTISDTTFVYFAAFDGTNNDMNDLSVSGNPLSTNVAELSREITQTSKVVVGYFPGVGTAGTLPGSSAIPSQVTAQMLITAKDAYNDFAARASLWLDSHPEGDITTALTGFSRGSVTAAIFSQLIFENGLIDPRTQKVLIPPGEVGVSAGLIFDPVGTGVNGNLIFAPNVNNITVVRAENEYRNLFKAVDYAGENGVATLTILGNHCDIGGGYDCGLGSLTLQAANSFFKTSGLAMSDVPTSRTFAPDAGVYIHDEAWDGTGDNRHRMWDSYSSVETDIGALRQVSNLTANATITTDPYNAFITISDYKDVYGNLVHYERQTDESGKFQEGSMKITDPSGNYVQRVYNNLYHEIYHNWKDANGTYWESNSEDKSHASGYDLNDGSSHIETYSADNIKRYDQTTTASNETTTLSFNYDGSTVKRIEHANGSTENYDTEADGTYYVQIQNSDGSYRYENHMNDGNEDIDYRAADGSGEQIANHGVSKYHATYDSKGGVVAVFSDASTHGSSTNDGRGSTTFDVWSDDGSEQHNWTKPDGSSSHETYNADGSKDITRTGGDGSSFELHTRSDGYSEQTTVTANGTITDILIHPDSSREEQVRGVELDTFYHEHWKDYNASGDLTYQSDEYKDEIGDNHELIISYNMGQADTQIITVHPDETAEQQEIYSGPAGSSTTLSIFSDYKHNVFTMSGTGSENDGTSIQYTGWGDHDIFSYLTKKIHPDGGTETIESNNVNGYNYYSIKKDVMKDDHTLYMITQNVRVLYADNHGYDEFVTFIGNDVTHNVTHF